MHAPTVTLTRESGVALITLNRPEQLNTLTPAMMQALGEAYQQVDQDDEVRVVVVTGQGRAFCAGADLSGGGDTFDTQAEMDFSSCPLSMQPWQIRKPVIAACNGHAIGVGFSMALQCDMRVLAEEGRYGLLQNRLGVVADNAVEFLLPRLVGFERAFELIVRAPRLTGSEAAEWGLATRVVPADQVLSQALALAHEMAEHCSPLVMGMHKRLLWRGLQMGLGDFVELETQALHYSMGRPDAIEGGVAFMENRAPQWRAAVSQDWPAFLDQ